MAHKGLNSPSRLILISLSLLVLLGPAACRQKPSRVYKVVYTSPKSARRIQSKQQAPPRDITPQWDNPKVANPPRIQDASSAPTPSTEYHLGTGDELKIMIWELLNVDRVDTQTSRVDLNGQIYLPVLKSVQAAGLTVKQLHQQLIQRIGREYVRDPQIDIRIVKYRSKEVVVLGMVGNPGSFYIEKDNASLMDMIGLAGGISSGAGPNIEILRNVYNPSTGAEKLSYALWQSDKGRNGNNRQVVPISLLFAQNGPLVNPIVYPGDVVKVLSGNEGYIYISGQVKQPGAKQYRRPLNILQAITMAGGLTKIAEERKCKIIRRLPNGGENTTLIDLKKINNGNHQNVELAQNDLIVISINKTKKFWDDLDRIIYRGVRAGVDLSYNAASDLGIPNSGGGF